MDIFYKILNILTLGFSNAVIEQRKRHSEITEIMDKCHEYEKIVIDYVTDNRFKFWEDDPTYALIRHRFNIMSKNRPPVYDLDYDEMYEMYENRIEYIEESFLDIPYFQSVLREKRINELL